MPAPLKARLLLAAIKQVPGGEELHLISEAQTNRFQPDPADPANEWLRLSPSATLKLFVADAAQFGTHKPGETLVIELRAITGDEQTRRQSGVKAVADKLTADRAAKLAARTTPRVVTRPPAIAAPVPTQALRTPPAPPAPAAVAPVPEARTNTP